MRISNRDIAVVGLIVLAGGVALALLTESRPPTGTPDAGAAPVTASAPAIGAAQVPASPKRREGASESPSPSADDLSAAESLGGVHVPSIGTVGDYPDAAHRHVVNVTADGRIVLAGRTLTCAELIEELKVRAKRSRHRVAGTKLVLSDESIVLRADGALPWGASQRLLVACTEALVWRIFFAVRHDGDGSEGAVGTFVPDGAPSAEDDPDLLDEWRAALLAKDGDGTPQSVWAGLVRYRAARKVMGPVTVDADPHVSTSAVLALADAALRAGATRVQFAIGPWDDRREFTDGFADAARAPRDQRVTHEIVLPEMPSDGPAPRSDPAHAPEATMPPVARVRGALVGVTK